MSNDEKGGTGGGGGPTSPDPPRPPAAGAWTPEVYDELRRIADRMLQGERRGHTLQPTALVHEAYIQLREAAERTFSDEGHFLAMAARVMRHILVDHARRRTASKRGGERLRVSFAEAERAPRPDAGFDVLELEELLANLASLDERKARVAELRLFAGATIPQVAGALGISTRAAEGDWHMARAWLKLKLSGEA
jgi:RNA polymerase sigma factor (TIGR02999 family)